MPDIGPLSPTARPSSPSPSGSSGSIGGLLREFHIPWPEADESALREAAATWHSLAETIRDNYGYANSAAGSLTGSNAGAAVDAFEKYWAKFAGGKGALLLGAEACDAMSNACTQYADDVASTKRKIEEAAAAVAATLIVGTIGAFITFGATEAAADALAATVVSAAGDWIIDIGLDLSTTLSLVSETVADAVASAAAITAAAVDSGTAEAALGAGIAGIAGGVGSAASTAALGQLTGKGTPAPSQFARDLVVSGLTAGTGGLLGKLGALSAPQLSRLLSNAADSVSTTDPQAFVSLMALSRQVAGLKGKIAASMLASAASQLIVSQNVAAESFTQDQLQQLLQDIAEEGQ